LIDHLQFGSETNTRKEKYKEKEDAWEEVLRDHQRKQVLKVKEEHKKFTQSPFAVVADSSGINEDESSYVYQINPSDSVTITSPSNSRRANATTAATTNTNNNTTSTQTTQTAAANSSTVRSGATTTTSIPTTTTTQQPQPSPNRIANPPPSGEPAMNFTLDIDKFVHYGVGCDSCGVFPIVGRRYKCSNCPEKIGFDLCQNCVKLGIKGMKGRFNQSHTEDHKMVEVMEHTVIHTFQAMNPHLSPVEILSLLRHYLS